MKKILFAAAAATVAFASPALAQTAANPITVGPATSIDIPLSGTVAKACTVSAYLNGPFSELNMTSTASQGSESLSVGCNYAGSASVTFNSANLGAMKSGANSVPYTFSVSNYLSDVSLASPQTVSWNVVSPPGVQTKSMSVKLTNAATVAGTYTDTITIAVTPN